METKLNGASVIFKGTVNGLTIILREEDTFEDILKEMEVKILTAGRFFKGAVLNVNYKGKFLTEAEKKEIVDLLVRKSGAEIKSFQKEISKFEENQNKQEKANNYITNRFGIFDGVDTGITKFHKGTVRSGQKISFDGNLVIFGDVNPGGELVASGNIIVLGALRGIVHAGADGNLNSIVAAFNLQPTLLKIANVITRSPDEKYNKDNLIPEMAYIKDELVYIDKIC